MRHDILHAWSICHGSFNLLCTQLCAIQRVCVSQRLPFGIEHPFLICVRVLGCTLAVYYTALVGTSSPSGAGYGRQVLGLPAVVFALRGSLLVCTTVLHTTAHHNCGRSSGVNMQTLAGANGGKPSVCAFLHSFAYIPFTLMSPGARDAVLARVPVLRRAIWHNVAKHPG